jgi:hypothetical protein
VRVQQRELSADLYRLGGSAQLLLAALEADEALGPRCLASQVYADVRAVCARHGSEAASALAQGLMRARRYAGDLANALAGLRQLDAQSRGSLRTAAIALVGELADALGSSQGVLDTSAKEGS